MSLHTRGKAFGSPSTRLDGDKFLFENKYVNAPRDGLLTVNNGLLITPGIITHHAIQTAHEMCNDIDGLPQLMGGKYQLRVL